jgi:hypothetical protein
MKFPIDRILSCPILKFWDLFRIMIPGQCRIEAQNCDSWNYLTNIMKFDSVWDLGRKPRAQVTTTSELKTIPAWRPIKWALICSIWITGTRVLLKSCIFLGKGPKIKVRFLDSYSMDLKSQTLLLLCSKFQLSRCYSGWEIRDRRKDGRTDVTTITVEQFF